MKTKLFALALLLANNAYAFNDNPYENFSSSANFTDNSHIRWFAVDNVRAVCDSESKKRGYGGINWPIKACSFYDNNKCDIYTSKQLNMHTLGHEVRHCFQGDFHK